MAAKTNQYLKASIIILIIIMLIFVFNLPKSNLFNLVIVTIVFIFYNELFHQKNKGRRGKSTSQLFNFFLFSLVLLISSTCLSSYISLLVFKLFLLSFFMN